MAAPRPARRIWAYWRAERRTLRQGFVALFISISLQDSLHYQGSHDPNWQSQYAPDVRQE